MYHGEYRSSVIKGGPRVLTFAPQTIPVVMSNCPKCSSGQTGFVRGEGGGDPKPLVHGWYQIETDSDIFWQQVNPEKAAIADPILSGSKLCTGESAIFFVDQAERDGIIVVFVELLDRPASWPGGIVRVLRKDTVLMMEETGENADLASPPISKECI